jgi:hypothetical protein
MPAPLEVLPSVLLHIIVSFMHNYSDFISLQEASSALRPPLAGVPATIHRMLLERTAVQDPDFLRWGDVAFMFKISHAQISSREWVKVKKALRKAHEEYGHLEITDMDVHVEHLPLSI